MYRGILGREPDTAGWNWWTREIDSGRRTLNQAFNDFFYTAEGLRLRRDACYSFLDFGTPRAAFYGGSQWSGYGGLIQAWVDSADGRDFFIRGIRGSESQGQAPKDYRVDKGIVVAFENFGSTHGISVRTKTNMYEGCILDGSYYYCDFQVIRVGFYPNNGTLSDAQIAASVGRSLFNANVSVGSCGALMFGGRILPGLTRLRQASGVVACLSLVGAEVN